MATKRKEYSPDKVLKNWRVMREKLMDMSETELSDALDRELNGEGRKDFLKRIARRLVRVRHERQLRELYHETGAANNG